MLRCGAVAAPPCRLHPPRATLPSRPAGLAILGISEKGGKASLPWYTFFIGSWSRDTPEEAAAFYR